MAIRAPDGANKDEEKGQQVLHKLRRLIHRALTGEKVRSVFCDAILSTMIKLRSQSIGSSLLTTPICDLANSKMYKRLE